MNEYTVIGIRPDEGFRNRFTQHVQAEDPEAAKLSAIKDQFIKDTGRPAPQTDYVQKLEDETRLFIVAVLEGDHDNLA
jgi:hypothetical protein